MRKFLGEILTEMEVTTDLEVNAALAKQRDDNDTRPIGEILVEMKACQPEHVARALAEQYDMRFIDLEAMEIPTQLLELIPRDTCRENKVIPVAVREGTLTVAMANPLDLGIIDSLRFSTSRQIEAAVASERQIIKALERGWGYSEDKLDQMLGELTENIEYRDLEDEETASGDDAPVIRYVTQILQNALDSKASDIHIEPMADRLRIRYRIDGICFAMDPAPKRLQGPVIQRIKIMAGMQVEERRRPQDGRIKAQLAGKMIDLRVSSLPAVYGESVVMRILDQDNLKLSLGDMGFDPTDYKRFSDLIRRPNGIILVTGPTGSGKTTTLYATLNELNTSDRKIITAEDPVEYMLDGINQCQVRHRIGLDFPRILRAMLRQAPNVILVGEIRDHETANIAINAALTGHLVFSTLHTNDAPSAITRLTDMDVAPFLVATSIQAVLAQRLIRTNCAHCAEPFNADPKHLKALKITPEMLEGRTLMRGRGCEKCNFSGYKGRRGIYELMVMNGQIRQLAFDGATTDQVRAAAIANGMNTLAMDGVRKVLQGITTPEEVLRIAKQDS
ncbi:MAG: type II/IV secretion system protein [Planctomycetota bacterium]|nr:MAG: type II/IV secretion system protein [Planctomycetota bacterium]